MSGPDVVVVGAGPAGSTTAGLLAERGWGVLVLERRSFPRPKACGECLNPGAVATLRRLGLLGEVLDRAPALLQGWDVRTVGGARATGRFGLEVGPGLALPRSELDAVLVHAARHRGARVDEGVRVTEVEPAESGRGPRVVATGSDGTPRRYAPALVVGADGLRSVVARAVGGIRRRPVLKKASLTFRVRGEGVPRGRGRLYLSDRATVGIAPVGGRGTVERGSRPGADLWNVTVVTTSPTASEVLGGDAAEVLTRALARAAPDWEGDARLVGGPWGSGPFDWPSRPLPAPGVVLVGDAAGYFDPLTGQGIYRALRSAEMAADAIDRTLGEARVSWARPSRYGSRVRRTFGPGRRLQRAVERVVSSPRLRELAVRRLAAAPATLDALIRVTGDARPVRSLATPGLLARLVAPSLATLLPASGAVGRP